MREDIQDFIDRTMPYQGSFKHLASMLPADDAELDAMLTESVQKVDGRAFPYLAYSALYAGRKVDSRHLEGGVMLITGYVNVLTVAWKCDGDVPKHLLAAMRFMALDMQTQAALFFLIAAWAHEGRGPIDREETLAMARVFARKMPPTSEFIFILVAAAHLFKDEAFKEVLSVFHKPIPEEKITDLIEGLMKVCRRPVLEGVDTKPDGKISRGATMRRAVARVGRNEPCPCGSGKKYKQCCIEKDDVRLHQSTEVEGVTRKELWQNVEQHLNPARMARCNPPDLLKFDPRKIDRYLLKDYFERLARFRMMDTVADAFEKLGLTNDLVDTWKVMMYWSHFHGRKDILQRLLQVGPEPEEVEKTLYFGYRLLLAEGNPAKTMELLQEHAKFVAENETPDEMQSFAMALLPTQLAALGIYVGRGVIPFLSDDDAQIVYKEILRARDRLLLPADDLYSDLMDERLTKGGPSGDDTESLHEAKRKLEEKAKEVREMKEALHQLQREISLREKKTPPVIAENVVALPLDEGVLTDLRDKVENLKTELKERHNERNELRRELQKAHTDIAVLRQGSDLHSDSDKAKAAKDQEDAMMLPEESLGQQPVRLIEFPKKFDERLASFPRHVARNAMKTIGEIASGDPAALMGVVRLKACPTISRQRIGIDVRLLFKLLPDRVQVVDLINRKDLERKIKTLV